MRRKVRTLTRKCNSMRQSNIELCRIASIVLILLVHSAFAANGIPTTLSASSLWLIILESISIIGVNVFILISGYFSIKLKPQTIYTLVFACAFYYILLTGTSVLLGEPFRIKSLLFVSHSHYFILDYLGLALLSPILNTFAENANKKTFFSTLLLLLVYQTYFGYIPGASRTEFDLGYSLMSFSILYLIARYIKLHGVHKTIKEFSGSLYITATALLATAICICLKTNHNGAIGLLIAYNNPLIIFSAVCFFLFFEKQDISSNKVINHIAKSTLGILLFHASTLGGSPIWKHWKIQFRNLTADFEFTNVILWIGLIILFFFIAVSVDQLRLYLSDKTLKIFKK